MRFTFEVLVRLKPWLITLAVVLLGTNLYHYATFDSTYSHPYSFFLFAALLDDRAAASDAFTGIVLVSGPIDNRRASSAPLTRTAEAEAGIP